MNNSNAHHSKIILVNSEYCCIELGRETCKRVQGWRRQKYSLLFKEHHRLEYPRVPTEARSPESEKDPRSYLVRGMLVGFTHSLTHLWTHSTNLPAPPIAQALCHCVTTLILAALAETNKSSTGQGEAGPMHRTSV